VHAREQRHFGRKTPFTTGFKLMLHETIRNDQGGLATAFDLAAFRLSMIAPVKKSVNHSRTVVSMRETGWEKQQKAHLRSDSTV